jgi:hypothetical protein
MADEIVWEAPPEPTWSNRPRVGKWTRLLAPLRDRPGEWANLGEHHCGTVSRIKTGQVGDAKPGEFEATSRGVDRETNKGTLYVRYVGQKGGE